MSFADFAHAAPKLPPVTSTSATARCATRPGSRTRAGHPYPDKAKKGIPEREIRENMIFQPRMLRRKDGEMFGVKLEDQVLVTKDGAVSLNTYPFEKKLL